MTDEEANEKAASQRGKRHPPSALAPRSGPRKRVSSWWLGLRPAQRTQLTCAVIVASGAVVAAVIHVCFVPTSPKVLDAPTVSAPQATGIRVDPNRPREDKKVITPSEPPGKLPESEASLFVMAKYDPSGFMGDINDISVKRGATSDVFRYEPRGIGKHEWEWKYVDGGLNPAPAKFAGVMYLDPPNNWGREYGGFDLRKVGGKLHWEARSLKGTVGVEFVIGGVRWFWDEKTKGTPRYPDSMPRTSLGVKELTEEWQPFDFSLAGVPSDNLSRVLGGFAWVITWQSNGVMPDETGKPSGQPRVFEIELRNIYYERGQQ